MNQGPFQVPGGRHLLAMHVDAVDSFLEMEEANNHVGEQWVWSLPDLALTGGLTAGAPPDPTGGFEHFTGLGSLHYNALGYRATFGAGTGLWGGVGIVPSDANDDDLRLHDPVAGIRDGLGASLRSSSWGPSETDFCIVRHDAPRTVEASVVRGDEGPGGPLDVAATGSATLASLPLSTPDQVLATNEVMRLHPVILPAGTARIRVTNTLGTIDWGVSLHNDSLAVQGRSDAIEQVYAAGAGLGEELMVAIPEPDTFVVAVWKRGSASRGQFGVYRVQVDGVTLDTPAGAAPLASRLQGARPAPFRERTTLTFDLAAAGEARLEVFDVRGARVRTLAEGRWNAGRHTVTWSGEDDRGRALPPGVYLARLQSNAGNSHLKLVKIE
jgi:hypothetical protein